MRSMETRSPDQPNLFTFGGSELSQDAVIAWLLTWADPPYKEVDAELHATGVALLQEGYSPEQITAIYYKTEDQSNLGRVRDAGFEAFSRHDMLSVLHGYTGDNAILTDYRDHLAELSQKYERHRTHPVAEWGAHAWQGFYGRLQELLGEGLWT
jgi:hypothetical protein